MRRVIQLVVFIFNSFLLLKHPFFFLFVLLTTYPLLATLLIDPSGGTVLFNDSTTYDDRVSSGRALGFTGSFFGIPKTTVDINTNGNMNFSSSTTYSNTAMPTNVQRVNVLWSDLIIRGGSGASISEKILPGIYYSATWSEVEAYSSTGQRYTFQSTWFGDEYTINNFIFQQDDIALSYEGTYTALSGGDSTIGLDQGNNSAFTSLPGISNGFVTNSNISVIPKDTDTFLLFRPNGEGNYIASNLKIDGSETTINAGTLVGTAASLEGNIVNQATLLFNQIAPGTYSGIISGSGAVTKQGSGVLTLTGNATYAGATTISAGSFTAGAVNAFSSSSAHTVGGSGTLDTSTFSNTIGSLAGSGTVSLGTGATLTIANGAGTTFSGSIGGAGALTLTNGTLTLSGTNSFSGGTTINGGTMQAGATSAFSPSSAYTLSGTSTLALNSFSNTIKSLTSNVSTTTVNLSGGILTINGGGSSTFAGKLTNSPAGGLTIGTGTTQTLSGTANDYSGPTQVNGTLNIIANGALSPNTAVTIAPGGTLNLQAPATANAAQSVSNSGTLATQQPLTLSSTYTQDSTGVIDITFNTAGPTGRVIAASNITIDGALNVTRSGGEDPSTGIYNLLDSTLGLLNGTFATYTPLGFTTTPTLSYSISEVNLLFGNCSGSWITDGNENWDDNANWSNGCSPGANGNTNDIATFGDSSVISPTVQVTVADDLGAAQELILYQMNFTSSATSYTISQASSASSITFLSSDPSIPQISVTGGSHTINTPLIIGESTNLVLSDGKELIFGSNTTLTSTSSDTFTLVQSNDSILGSGLLVNEGTLTPYNMSVTSASLTNSATIAPTNLLTLAASSGRQVTVINSGSSAVMGSTVDLGSLTIGGAGTTTITNSSGGLIRGGSGGTITISGATITNDLTSVIGTSGTDIVFSSGTLETVGEILARNYTQSAPAVLEIVLTDFPTVYGNIAATGVVNVDGTLIVNDLYDSVQVGEIADLITGTGGVVGTYSDVRFIGVATGITPSLIYGPNSIGLVHTNTITPMAVGSFTQIPITSVNQVNILIRGQMSNLQGRLGRGSQLMDNRDEVASMEYEAPSNGKFVKVALGGVNRKKDDLAERTSEQEKEYSSRFYIGPVDSFGTFNSKGTAQTGFGYNAIGVFTGVDHAFEEFGLGFAAEYTHTKAHVHDSGGNFRVSNAQGNIYATWVPSAVSAFALDVLAGYGYQWFNTNRSVGTSLNPSIAHGTTGGMVADSLIGLSYIFSNNQIDDIPRHLVFTPLINLQYIWSKVRGYDETGADVYNLSVDSQSANSLRTTLGARLEYTFEFNRWKFKPELDLGWQHEFLDHDREVNFTTLNLTEVQSISQTVVGAGRNSLLAGVDFLFTIYEVFELEVSYDLQWNNLYIDNTFYFGIGGKF